MQRILGASALAVMLSFVSAAARAYEHEFEQVVQDWDLVWSNRVSFGAYLRAENPDKRFIGKSQLDPTLCAEDDCLNVTGPGPNERYLAAPGAYLDLSDLSEFNYRKGDIAEATGEWVSHLDLSSRQFGFRLGGLAFYDPVNTGFEETHPNEITTPGPHPTGGERVKHDRPRQGERQVGWDAQLLEANAWLNIPFGDEETAPITVTVGRQNLLWGESTFSLQGSLNIANPLDANAALRPGLEFTSLYTPVGMVLVQAPLVDAWTVEAFYQYEWVPYSLPPRGSFFGYVNAGNELEPYESLVGLFSKAPEDPRQLGTPNNSILKLVSATSYSLTRTGNHEPSDGGQYGIAFYSYIEDWLEEPLTLGFYYANYHSRVPDVSATAGQASCTRREGNARHVDDTSLADFVIDCGIPAVDTPGTTRADGYVFEALPLESVHYFLDYPENIHMFGFSFDAQIARMAVRGELAYRPNDPVQVDLLDVIFAAAQPILPRSDIDLALATLPSSRSAVPDFLTAYRGGTPGEVAPGSYVRGYERMKTLHGSLDLTKLLGGTRSLFGSEDSAFYLEMIAEYVPDLPSTDRLQMFAPGNLTHHGPATLVNPVHNDGDYVTKVSAGYRGAAIFHYQDVVIPELNFRPAFAWVHDVVGTGPGLAQNFVHGRKLAIANGQFQYREYRFDLIYGAIFGAGTRNLLRDKDFYGVSMSYEF